jgi:hypothetical protein
MKRCTFWAVIGFVLLALAAVAAVEAMLWPDITFTSATTLTVPREQKPFYFTAVTMTFATEVTNQWEVFVTRRGTTHQLLDVTTTNTTIIWNVERLLGRYYFRRSDSILFTNSVADQARLTFSGEFNQ